MTELTIPQRPSGTGSIHDIRDNMCERVIRFRKGTEYAVVLAAYYGPNVYTTHKTEQAAAKEDIGNEMSSMIVDAEGYIYDTHEYEEGQYRLIMNGHI